MQNQQIAAAFNEIGWLTEQPEMCGSRTRIYDRPYLDCLADIDAAIQGQRHPPRLLRHDDGHRVVLLGDANRGTMPRPQRAAEPRVDRQRQEARRGRHAITLHDDGTWSYQQTTTLIVPGYAAPFAHTDQNTLHKIGEATPNPTALAAMKAKAAG